MVVPITPQQVAQALVAGLHKESPEILVGGKSFSGVVQPHCSKVCGEGFTDGYPCSKIDKSTTKT